MTPSRSQGAGRIAVLTYYNVNEAASGGTRRVSELLKAIGSDRALLLQPRAVHTDYDTRTYSMDFGRRRVGINWGIFNFFWPSTARRVLRWIDDAAPRTMVLCSIWAWAPFRRKRPGCPVILDAQNVDAVAIAERFGWHHPFTRLVHFWERKVCRSVDLIMACSDVDRELFIKHYDVSPDKIIMVPNGADVPDEAELAARPLDDQVEKELSGSIALMFVGGKLNYPPNAEGLDFIANHLLPELERRVPGRFKVLVAGTPIPDKRPHPAVIFLGRVPSLGPYLRRASVCLAPIFNGSGTRLKVLDYLAWARPVVATPKSVEGINCKHQEHVIVADKSGFVDAVLDLSSNAANANRLGQQGRDLVRQHYSWTAIRNRWRKILDGDVGVSKPDDSTASRIVSGLQFEKDRSPLS